MASEIRVNKIANRAGLSTVQYTDTGIIVSGIVTATELSGLSALNISGVGTATTLDINGDIDVDGHTNLDNLSVAGVSTFSNAVNIANGTISRTSTGSNLIFQTDLETRLFHSSNNNVKLTFYGSGETLRGSIEAQATQIQIKDSGGRSGLVVAHGAESRLYFNDNEKFRTTNTGTVVTGILTATSFSGDGSSLSNLPAGAPVGGASTNTVFFENDTAVAVNYQITTGKNAMSAGPIAINAGIAVTVPSGSSWTIV